MEMEGGEGGGGGGGAPLTNSNETKESGKPASLRPATPPSIKTVPFSDDGRLVIAKRV